MTRQSAESADQVKQGRAPRCDLWYIDGGHTFVVPLSDMKWAHRASRNGTTLVADDCHRHWPSVLNGWADMRKSGRVRTPESFRPKYFEGGGRGGGNHGGSGYCAGIAVNVSSGSSGRVAG